MNYSTLFKNAILNLYKNKIYTVDYAILKTTDYADRNKINADDYTELMTYLAKEQEASMEIPDNVTEESIEEISEDI